MVPNYMFLYLPILQSELQLALFLQKIGTTIKKKSCEFSGTKRMSFSIWYVLQGTSHTLPKGVVCVKCRVPYSETSKNPD